MFMAVDERRGSTARTVVFWLLVAFVFVQPWRHAVTIRPGLSIGPAVGAVLAATWIGVALLSGDVRRPHGFHVAVGLFVGLSAASVLWTIDVGRTLSRVGTLGYILVLLVVSWDLLVTRKRIAIVAQALVLGVALVGIAGIVELIQQGGLYGRENLVFGVNANELARLEVLAVPFAAGLLANSRRFGSGVGGTVNLGFLVLVPFMVLATGSRQGALALAALGGIGLLLLVRRGRAVGLTRGHLAASLLVFSGAVLTISAVASLAIFVDRLPLAFSRLGTLGGRTPIWMEGIAAFRANPLVGVGAGAYGAITPPGMGADPHNTIVGVAAELGIVGLLAFSFVAAVPIRAAVAGPGPTYQSLGIFLVLGLFASVAMLYNDPLNWVIVLLVLAAHSLPPSSERTHTAAAGDADREATEVEPP